MLKNRLSGAAVLGVLISLVMQAGPSDAALQNDGRAATPSGTVRNQGLDPEAMSAMKAAANGDSSALEGMLASPKAEMARQAVVQWVTTHPTPTPNLDSRWARQGVTASPMATGSYDYYCTGYNGFTIGWNGKTFRACHGYLDQYISGSHVGHYIPDSYPTGNPLSMACKKSLAGVIVWYIGVLGAGVPTGGLGWGAFTIVTAWTVQDVAINCKRIY